MNSKCIINVIVLLLTNKTSHDCSLIVNKLYSNCANGKQVSLLLFEWNYIMTIIYPAKDIIKPLISKTHETDSISRTAVD